MRSYLKIIFKHAYGLNKYVINYMGLPAFSS